MKTESRRNIKSEINELKQFKSWCDYFDVADFVDLAFYDSKCGCCFITLESWVSEPKVNAIRLCAFMSLSQFYVDGVHVEHGLDYGLS